MDYQFLRSLLFTLILASVQPSISKAESLDLVIGGKGPAGGIVFYLDASGKHGMEAAPVDQGSAPWGCYGKTINGADGTDVGTGKANTTAIVAGCANPWTAAKIADAYSLNGYDDWFLPSKDELNLLYSKQNIVGGFVGNNNFLVDCYWSSSNSLGDKNYTAWNPSVTSVNH